MECVLGTYNTNIRDLGFRDVGFRDLGLQSCTWHQRDQMQKGLGFRDLGFRV